MKKLIEALRKLSGRAAVSAVCRRVVVDAALDPEGKWITVHPQGGEPGRRVHLDENGKIDSKGPTSEALKEKEDNGGAHDIRFSLVGTTADGTEIYQTPRKIKDLKRGEKAQRFKFSLEGFDALPISLEVNGGKIALKTSARDRKHLKGSGAGMSGWGYEAKLNTGASGDFYDVVSGAEYEKDGEKTAESVAHHPDVERWMYFKKQVVVDGRKYTVIANVARKKEGDFLHEVLFQGGEKSGDCPTPLSLRVGKERRPDEPVNLEGSNTENDNIISQGAFHRQGGNLVGAMTGLMKRFWGESAEVREISPEEAEKELGKTEGDAAKNGVGAQDIRFERIGTTADGTEIYKTPEEIKNLKLAERAKMFKKSLALNEKLPVDIRMDGDKLVLGTSSVDKRHLAKSREKMSWKGFEAKLSSGASGDIYDILSGAQFCGEGNRTEESIAHHPDVNRWLYFKKKVVLDNRIFEVLANVARKGTGDFLHEVYFNFLGNADNHTEPLSLSSAKGRISAPGPLRGSDEDFSFKISAENDNIISQGAFHRQGGNLVGAMTGLMKRFWGESAEVREISPEEAEKELGAENGDRRYMAYVGKTLDGVEMYDTRQSTRDLPKEEKEHKALQKVRGLLQESHGGGDVLIGDEISKELVSQERDDAKKMVSSSGIGRLNREVKLATIIDDNLPEILRGMTLRSREDDTLAIAGHPVNKSHKGVREWRHYGKNVEIDGVRYFISASVREKPHGGYLYNAVFFSGARMIPKLQYRKDIDISKDADGSRPSKTENGKSGTCGELSASSTVGIISKGVTDRQGGNFRQSLIIGEEGAARLDPDVRAVENLRVAREMLGGKDWEKMSRDEKVKIKLATGWEKGKDGKWRRESADIPDRDWSEVLGKKTDLYEQAYSKFKAAEKVYEAAMFEPEPPEGTKEREEFDKRYAGIRRAKDAAKAELDYAKQFVFKPVPLAEVLGTEHEIIKAYPELADMPIRLEDTGSLTKGGGLHLEAGGVMSINIDPSEINDAGMLKNTLTHEIQHAIQIKEGHGMGGNTWIGREIEAAENAEFQKWLDGQMQKQQAAWKRYRELEDKCGWTRFVEAEMKANKPLAEFKADKQKFLKEHPDFAAAKAEYDRIALEGQKDARRQAHKRRTMEETSLIPGYAGYRRISGEVEARNAGRRTEADRGTAGKELLEDTEDVAREDQVVIERARQAIENEGKVAGWFDRTTGKTTLVKGRATAKTVAHEMAWHMTYKWSEKNHPELHKKLKQYAEEATDGVKQSVKAVYGRGLSADELLDEVGAERFTREDLSPLLKAAEKAAAEGWFDKVEGGIEEARKRFADSHLRSLTGVRAASVGAKGRGNTGAGRVKGRAQPDHLKLGGRSEEKAGRGNGEGQSGGLTKEEVDRIAAMPPKEAVKAIVQAMIEGRGFGFGKRVGEDGGEIGSPRWSELMAALERIAASY